MEKRAPQGQMRAPNAQPDHERIAANDPAGETTVLIQTLSAAPFRLDDHAAHALAKQLVGRFDPACDEFEDAKGASLAYACAFLELAADAVSGENEPIEGDDILLVADIFGILPGEAALRPIIRFVALARQRRTDPDDIRRLASEYGTRDPDGFLRAFENESVNGSVLREILSGGLIHAMSMDGLHGLVDRWVAKRRPVGLKRFMLEEAAADVNREREQPAPAEEPGGSPEAEDDVGAVHRQLLMDDLGIVNPDQQEAMQAIIVYGFVRPGQQNSGYRTGSPVMRSNLWKITRSKVKSRLNPNTFDAAMNWLVKAGIVEWVGNHETFRLDRSEAKTKEGLVLYERVRKMIGDIARRAT